MPSGFKSRVPGIGNVSELSSIGGVEEAKVIEVKFVESGSAGGQGLVREHQGQQNIVALQ